MNEERKLILEMLRDGTVTVDEAERLLTALAQDAAEGSLVEFAEGAEPQSNALVLTGSAPSDGGGSKTLRPKRLVVAVTSNNKPMVNIRLPFSLVRAGLKIGKSFTGIGAKHSPDAAQAFEILQGIDLDELLDSIGDGDISLPYTIVDVDDEEKGEHVRIVLE